MREAALEHLRFREETSDVRDDKAVRGVTDPAEAGRRVNEGFVPLIQDLPGFVAYYWLDAGRGVMASTSVFQDRAGAESSTETAADWVRENIAELLPNPPEVTTGEVVASG